MKQEDHKFKTSLKFSKTLSQIKNEKPPVKELSRKMLDQSASGPTINLHSHKINWLASQLNEIKTIYTTCVTLACK